MYPKCVTHTEPYKRLQLQLPTLRLSVNPHLLVNPDAQWDGVLSHLDDTPWGLSVRESAERFTEEGEPTLNVGHTIRRS